MKVKCRSNLVFEDGSLSFKKGGSYKVLETKTDNGDYLLLNEDGCHHYTGEWSKYFNEI